MWPCRGRAAQLSQGGHVLSESPPVCGREAPEPHAAGLAIRAAWREELLTGLFILFIVTDFSSFVFQSVRTMCSSVTHSSPLSVFVHSVPNRVLCPGVRKLHGRGRAPPAPRVSARAAALSRERVPPLRCRVSPPLSTPGQQPRAHGARVVETSPCAVSSSCALLAELQAHVRQRGGGLRVHLHLAHRGRLPCEAHGARRLPGHQPRHR